MGLSARAAHLKRLNDIVDLLGRLAALVRVLGADIRIDIRTGTLRGKRYSNTHTKDGYEQRWHGQ